MKLSHTKIIVISGLIWMAIGVYLLQLGLGLLLTGLHPSASQPAAHLPMVQAIALYVGGMETAALLLVIVALYIGYFKGRYVLGKSAQRGVDRILTFPNPMPLQSIYSPKYYILLGGIIALGMSIKFLGLNNDIRGLVDVIIGSALVNGAMIYFRLAQSESQKAKT